MSFSTRVLARADILSLPLSDLESKRFCVFPVSDLNFNAWSHLSWSIRILPQVFAKKNVFSNEMCRERTENYLVSYLTFSFFSSFLESSLFSFLYSFLHATHLYFFSSFLQNSLFSIFYSFLQIPHFSVFSSFLLAINFSLISFFIQISIAYCFSASLWTSIFFHCFLHSFEHPLFSFRSPFLRTSYLFSLLSSFPTPSQFFILFLIRSNTHFYIVLLYPPFSPCMAFGQFNSFFLSYLLACLHAFYFPDDVGYKMDVTIFPTGKKNKSISTILVRTCPREKMRVVKVDSNSQNLLMGDYFRRMRLSDVKHIMAKRR